ncbi:MAG: hypothetical protein ACYC56_02415 [Candidatus Aquicultor sp.]
MRYKRYFAYVLCLLLPLASTSCSSSNQEKSTLEIPRLTTSDSSTTLHTNKFVDRNKIQWVTMSGGLELRTKVLYQENAPKKLQRIIEMINRATKERASTKIEIENLYSRAHPIGILIGFKNGTRAFVGPVYSTNTPSSSKIGAQPSSDYFIINYQNDNKSITAFSKEVASYLISHKWEEDMPTVRDVNINKQKFKVGDTVTLSGDGCIEKEVKIYLQLPTLKKRYLIGQVMPKFGQWKWHSTIQKEFITPAGKHSTIDPGSYLFGIYFGEEWIGTGQVAIQ